jgi:two-component system NtrC family sensor kinase
MSSDQEAKHREEVERLQEQLFHLAKLAEMGKLLAVVVHELSQPLLGIKAFAQILRRKYSGDAFVEPKVRMIEQQAVHMEELLDGLRQYSTLERREQAGVDPLVPIRSAVDLFRERAKKLRVRLTLDAQGSLPKVSITRGQLQQVVSNLIHNALDELDKTGGEVLIHAAGAPDQVTIRVADTGGGVPAEVREKIFDPFFTTKDKSKGTGLGLSICREILRARGGEILLHTPESARGLLGGAYTTVFEVQLPIHPPA